MTPLLPKCHHTFESSKESTHQSLHHHHFFLNVLNEFSLTDKYKYTTDGQQSKKFDVDAHASTSLSSSFDHLSSHLSDGVNAIEPSQNPINSTTVIACHGVAVQAQDIKVSYIMLLQI